MDAYQAIKFIYQSYVMAQPYIATRLLDIDKRHPGYCRQLLLSLGLDLSQPPSVLIAGSKGKGSTSALIASLMQAAGYKTGLFTGPHLVDFCERIRIDWQKIPEHEFVRLVEAVKTNVDTMQASMPQEHYLGPVGTVLAVALLWFREQGTNFHVLECGRGALADDVNVMANRWSVLTPIMYEHPGYLGPSLLDIAANKMAVVKSGQELCVSYRQDPEVAILLKSLCQAVNVPLKLGGEDFTVRVIKSGLEGSIFEYQSLHRKSVFSVPLAGRFQAFNAGVAIALAEEVVPDIDDDLLQAGLSSARWPGRCQLVAGAPAIILDGAINAQSAEFLRELLAQREEPLYIVLGVPADKDWQGVVRTLAPAAEAVWLTDASNAHLEFPPADAVLAEAKRFNPCSQAVPDAVQAFDEAVAAAGTRGTVVVAGTLSLLRDAKIYIQSRLGRECDE
jgi:dihydrofolate synthase/folylpolyglutamate synthase